MHAPSTLTVLIAVLFAPSRRSYLPPRRPPHPAGTKGKHTFVHDAEEADVSASRATDGGEIELQEQPPAAAEEAGGEPSPPGFIKRRLSIAAGMTAEGS